MVGRRTAAGLLGLLVLFSSAFLWQQHRAVPTAAAQGAGVPASGELVSALPILSAPAVPAAELSVPATPAHPAYTLYTPGGPAGAPAPVTLVVLHGMGGTGPGMAAAVLPFARAQGWTVIAPTIPYGEWRDPGQLTREELGLQPQLAGLLDAVKSETGVEVGPRVLFFGFSRGAQAALRFAMLYPQRVQAVAACSAGTYTLPTAAVKTAAGASLDAPLPFGVADLEQRAGRVIDSAGMSGVRFLIGVGSRDNKEGDVPRQWDPFVGKNRVERAERFGSTLSGLGMRTQVVVVPDTGHELSAGMMEQVNGFLTAAAGELQAQASAATTTVPAPAPAPVVRTSGLRA